MTSTTRIAVLCLCLAAALSAPANAVGPVDGEVAAVWWANDYDTAGLSTDAGAPGYLAEVWLRERYGVRATMFSSDLDDFSPGGSDSSEYTSVDVMWRAFSPTENNFVAVGLGWEQVDLPAAGGGGDTSGVRLAVEGRIGIVGALYGYGQAAYLPSMDDALAYENIDGMEYEVGVSWNPAPFVALRAGYRENSLDYEIGATSESAESKGFMVGLGVAF